MVCDRVILISWKTLRTELLKLCNREKLTSLKLFGQSGCLCFCPKFCLQQSNKLYLNLLICSTISIYKNSFVWPGVFLQFASTSNGVGSFKRMHVNIMESCEQLSQTLWKYNTKQQAATRTWSRLVGGNLFLLDLFCGFLNIYFIVPFWVRVVYNWFFLQKLVQQWRTNVTSFCMQFKK